MTPHGNASPVLRIAASRPLAERLASSPAAAAIKVVDRPPYDAALIDSLAGESPAATVRQVWLYDGRLGPQPAEALARDPPVLLLAARDRGGSPSAWEAYALAALLIRGAEPPATAAESRSWTLSRVDDIAQAAAEADRTVRALGGGDAAARAAADVMHEIAANALLDAPADPSGRPRYAHGRDRVTAVDPDDACSVWLASDGERLYLGARDRFGRLAPAAIARAAARVGKGIRVDDRGGGAGLGLVRVLAASDLVAVRVVPQRSTEVLCAVGLDPRRRRGQEPKSVLVHIAGA